MTFTPEQVLAAHKANVETLFGLTAKAFEGVEKLVELNLQVAKTTLSEACLLYTSDAADDLLCVDLGGRRIIQKKNRNKCKTT